MIITLLVFIALGIICVIGLLWYIAGQVDILVHIVAFNGTYESFIKTGKRAVNDF